MRKRKNYWKLFITAFVWLASWLDDPKNRGSGREKTFCWIGSVFIILNDSGSSCHNLIKNLNYVPHYLTKY